MKPPLPYFGDLESSGYATGRRTGERLGYERAFASFYTNDIYNRALSYVVDDLDVDSMTFHGWVPA